MSSRQITELQKLYIFTYDVNTTNININLETNYYTILSCLITEINVYSILTVSGHMYLHDTVNLILGNQQSIPLKCIPYAIRQNSCGIYLFIY